MESRESHGVSDRNLLARVDKPWTLAAADRAENQRNPQPPAVRVSEPRPGSDRSVDGLDTLDDVRARAGAFAHAPDAVPDLLPRAFVPVPGSARSPRSLRFLQFNVLARGLSSPPRFGGFTESPPACLDYHGFRKFRLLEEVLRFSPDVIALEEVDHFVDFWQPAMDAFGYDGVFQAKREAPGLKIWDEMKKEDREGEQPFFSDGTAIFWKRSAVTGLASGAIGYDSGEEEKGVLWGQVGIYVRLCLTMTAAAPASLSQSSSPSREEGIEARSDTLHLDAKTVIDEKQIFVVAATHLKARAGAENEARRESQMSQLMSRLESFRTGRQEPVVVMGDFNAVPSEASHKLVTGGRLGLESAYVLGGGKEPEYTTCKVRERDVTSHVIDFIMVPRSAKVRALLSVPPLDSLSEGMLPNWDYPSDHLSIGADVELAL